MSQVAAMLMVERGLHGPADGLLAEIQRDALGRHPDWARRLREFEAAPFAMFDPKRTHRQMRPKAA